MYAPGGDFARQSTEPDYASEPPSYHQTEQISYPPTEQLSYPPTEQLDYNPTEHIDYHQPEQPEYNPTELLPMGAHIPHDSGMDSTAHLYDPVSLEGGHYHASPETPIPAGYVELPELPPELAGLEHHLDEAHPEDRYATGMHEPLAIDDGFQDAGHTMSQHAPMYHDAPFDVVSAQAGRQGGFPYAIPDDPKPHPSTRIPLIAAAALVVIILVVAVLIPLSSARTLQAELRELEEQISNHVSSGEWYELIQRRDDINDQINAFRHRSAVANERMNTVRDFYLRLPALVIIPEILYESGLHVDSIEATENVFSQQIVITGRTNDLRSIHDGVQHLRLYFVHHNLLNVTFGNPEIDADMFATFTITLAVHPSWMPFWLNDQEVRSWS